MFTNHLSYRKHGFTLIEVLLVVSIIVLLISMLLASLASVKDTMKERTCQVNLKLIYSATIKYGLDNAKYIPLSRGRTVNGVRTEPWVKSPWYGNISNVHTGTLYEYTQNDRVYLCAKFEDIYRTWNPANANRTAVFSYSLNEYAGNSWQGKAGVRTISGARRPAELLMYTDENAWLIIGPPQYSRAPLNNGALGVGTYGNVGSIVDSVGSVHQAPGGNYDDGFANVVFYDGHIDLVHPADTKEVATPFRYKQ